MATGYPRKITLPTSSLLFFIFSLFIRHTQAEGDPRFHDSLNPSEKKALHTFINSLTTHTPRNNWNDSAPTCSWRGVTCDPSNITVLYLRLPGMQLVGVIPPNSIGMLTNLRILSLQHNQLSGPVPSDFSNLNYLTRLYLNDNKLSDNIPPGFTNFPYLIRLRLENNHFTGQLPDMNGQDFTSFNVSNNKLVGRIPSSLSKFPTSAFANNDYLCGPPLPPCNASYPPPESEIELGNEPTGRRAIFGVYSGSTLVLLIVVCSIGKKLYQKIKPPVKGSDMERKKLVTLFEDDGFDLEDLLKNTAKVLGQGSLGTSYKQVIVGKNVTVVAKILKGVVLTDEEFKTRMQVLGKMKNKYLVPLRAFCNYSSDEKLLVYDYMPAGSLSAHLHGSIGLAKTQLKWDHRMRIALSAAKGLTYLHMVEEIVHGNITSSNIFLQQESKNEVLLSDYGLITLFRGSSSLKHRITGYWAPEVLETWAFTFQSDVYSFGVLLLELLTGKILNPALLDKEGVRFTEWVGSIVCEEPRTELLDMELVKDDNIDQMLKLLQIAKDCVLIAPDQRPPMCDVLSMMEDIMSRQSPDYNSKRYHNRPSMETRDTSSTITLGTP